MLTIEDCLEICGLSKEEIRYIVEHEHVSELQVAELAEKYVVFDADGVPHLRRAIATDIEELQQQHRSPEARALKDFIRDFAASHPHVNRLYAA